MKNYIGIWLPLLITVIITAGLVVIYYIKNKISTNRTTTPQTTTTATTVPANITTTQMTDSSMGTLIATIVILFGVYCILLWAFALIWPDAWEAWSGSGFWVCQFLFISAVVIFSISWIRRRGFSWVLGVLSIILAIILMAVTISRNLPPASDGSNNLTDSHSQTSTDLSCTLAPGESKTFHIPLGQDLKRKDGPYQEKREYYPDGGVKSVTLINNTNEKILIRAWLVPTPAR